MSQLKSFNLKISDSSFLNDDGTLAETSNLGRAIIINEYNIILWNTDFTNIEIEFWKSNKLVGRFESDLKSSVYWANFDGNLTVNSPEVFMQSMINHHPVLANWLIWNPL